MFRQGSTFWIVIFGAASTGVLLYALTEKNTTSIWIAGIILLIGFWQNFRIWRQNHGLNTMSLQEIQDEHSLNQALKANIALLYKHSTACGVSVHTMASVRRFSEWHPDIPVYLLKVIEQRALSNQAAERTGIIHQSPQVILIKNRAPAWHASHFDITAEGIDSALKVISD